MRHITPRLEQNWVYTVFNADNATYCGSEEVKRTELDAGECRRCDEIVSKLEESDQKDLEYVLRNAVFSFLMNTGALK